MAIIVDPDNLDRNQVIFGTTGQKLSIYPVGALTNSIAEKNDGVSVISTNNFTSAGAQFVSDAVLQGQILALKSNSEAGHWVINSAVDENTLTVFPRLDNTSAFFVATQFANYEVRANTGGSVVDGATEQAVYSFAKEEWIDDLIKVGGDNLIRHEFPLETITSEQFEVGGGAAHAAWTWFNDFTRKKVRTGGWADKNTAATTLQEWAGIITLGSLDTDAQVYYQQVDVTAGPNNFTFQGTVNEAIQTFLDGGDDNRTFLKLFARKKARTYAGADLSTIGVTTIQTIVNRFPLSHAVDPAILASDGSVLGATPFRNQDEVTLSGAQTDGDTLAVGGTTFEDADATFFADEVVPGDTLNIISGAVDLGTYEILSVADDTLTVDNSELSGGGWTTDDTGITYNVTTRFSHVDRDGAGGRADLPDGALADVDGDTGTLTSANGQFLDANLVVIGDIVHITDVASDHRGYYVVEAVASNTVLTVNTADNAFTAVSTIDYRITRPGMFLQFKEAPVLNDAATDYSFDDSFADAGGLPTILKVGGTLWNSDIRRGTAINVVSATVAGNNGDYTVFSRVNDDNIALISGEVLFDSANDATASINANTMFVREIGSSNNTFRWKVSGNGGTLNEVFEFIQHQMRQTTDIDEGPEIKRGDITDLLMSFSTPTGTGLDLFIDDLISTDINNSTFRDHSVQDRNFPFTAAGTISFNNNLQGDVAAFFWLFFTNDDAPGDDLARDYGTKDAILVNDFGGSPITGNVAAAASINFDYDYDNNQQRGSGAAATDAPVTLIAIGLATAQFFITTGTLTRSTSISLSAVAALERNFSNPV